MKRQDLEHLVNPDTQERLSLVVEQADGEEVRQGALVAATGSYRIRDGIATFLPGEVGADQTKRSFDKKWELHSYYREHTRRFYTDWYLKRYGFEAADGLRDFLSAKRFILDAGTGAGRDATMFAQLAPSAAVYAVDTSWAALSRLARDPGHPPVAAVHADVNRLPFADGFFDFINCDQVIHHTPDPPAAFRNLGRKLRRGGEVTCYVYQRKSAVREFTDDYVRGQVAHLPFDEALEACRAITSLGKTLSDLRVQIEVDDIPMLGIRKGTYDLQRFFHWHIFKCFWNDEFDFFTNNVINADWYHPTYCYRYEPQEFREWFREGWQIVTWDEQEAGISCRARKL